MASWPRSSPLTQNKDVSSYPNPRVCFGGPPFKKHVRRIVPPFGPRVYLETQPRVPSIRAGVVKGTLLRVVGCFEFPQESLWVRFFRALCPTQIQAMMLGDC